MKAITMYQPWASLVALGAKKYETRSWGTKYRGLLAIHAAKTKKWRHLFDTFPLVGDALKRNGFLSFDHLPFGAVIAVVELMDIFSTGDNSFTSRLGYEELSFGNYQPGRKAWELELKQRFERPIPVRGWQGLWEWGFPTNDPD